MNKIEFILCSFFLTTFIFISCKNKNESTSISKQTENNSTNKDLDGQIAIGSQVWMLENLNVDKFRDGSPILEAQTEEEWKKAIENKQPAWCHYDNKPVNGAKYGKLYNWYAVKDSRILTPIGWHIPSDSDWKTLMNYLVSNNIFGNKIKNKAEWKENRSGTIAKGFSDLPGGLRASSGTFYDIGHSGSWWSSSGNFTSGAWGRFLYFHNADEAKDIPYDIGINGYSVRCLRD